jgi:hypothetical protein
LHGAAALAVGHVGDHGLLNERVGLLLLLGLAGRYLGTLALGEVLGAGFPVSWHL